MDGMYSVQAQTDQRLQVKNVPVNAEIKTQLDELQKVFESLRGAVDVLDEKTGYIQLPRPETDGNPTMAAAPMPTRSPHAHNLACLVNDANYLLGRIRDITAALEI